jgi:hypothetical protein
VRRRAYWRPLGQQVFMLQYYITAKSIKYMGLYPLIELLLETILFR